jgi:hypothetical protein
MMLKFLPLTALALGLSGGVALADHRGGDNRGGDHRGASVEHRAAPQAHVTHGGGNVVIRDRGGHAGGNVVIRDRGGYGGYGHGGYVGHGGYGGRVVVNTGPRFSGGYRRPIYVSRPVIRERYYNQYRRPALIVESYNPMAGYFWVAGGWSWTGYEWTWQPGHYQPDPNYYDGSY